MAREEVMKEFLVRMGIGKEVANDFSDCVNWPTKLKEEVKESGDFQDQVVEEEVTIDFSEHAKWKGVTRM